MSNKTRIYRFREDLITELIKYNKDKNKALEYLLQCNTGVTRKDMAREIAKYVSQDLEDILGKMRG